MLLSIATGAVTADESQMITALTAANVDPAQARLNYMLNCQGCHAVDGRGLNDIPTMADFVGKFLAVDGGRAYLVRVPGSANAPLSDAELAEVLNWILITMSYAHLPKPFVPYTPSEVYTFRQQPLTDAAAKRQQLLTLLENG